MQNHPAFKFLPAISGYPLWTGDRYNERFKKKRVEFPDFEAMEAGVMCADNTWRKIITLTAAEKGGCDLFDIKELKLEYSPDEYRNLFMCHFVDDAQGVFRLADLEAAYVDSSEWKDFNPTASRPYGNFPVWGGYDPSRSRDDASFVIVAPPLVQGGKFRLLERHKWVNKTFSWQAAEIKRLTDKYNFAYIGVDVTGPGLGVIELVKEFYPRVTPILYSMETKTQLVLKAKDVIESQRIEWDASQTDVSHAFLTVKQTATKNGGMTYAANRTASTGHADAAFSIMHALHHEPIAHNKNRKCGFAVSL